MDKKVRIWRIIFMLPWVALMVLYFIWANQYGFDISKNAMGIFIMSFSSIFWYALSSLMAEIFVSDE
jgi:hypothetical protein